MAKLIYSAIMSLDGYIADEDDNFDWAAPDEEVHRFINALQRPIGTYLFGRAMYETMRAWEHPENFPEQPPAIMEFAAIWQGVEKIVYSKTLDAVSTAKTRLERKFDAAAIRELKAGASADLSIGGPNLAAHAIRGGLIDEWYLFIVPMLIGGGKHYLPGGVRLKLDLLEESRFASGMLYLRYQSKQ